MNNLGNTSPLDFKEQDMEMINLLEAGSSNAADADEGERQVSLKIIIGNTVRTDDACRQRVGQDNKYTKEMLVKDKEELAIIVSLGKNKTTKVISPDEDKSEQEDRMECVNLSEAVSSNAADAEEGKSQESLQINMGNTVQTHDACRERDVQSNKNIKQMFLKDKKSLLITIKFESNGKALLPNEDYEAKNLKVFQRSHHIENQDNARQDKKGPKSEDVIVDVNGDEDVSSEKKKESTQYIPILNEGPTKDSSKKKCTAFNYSLTMMILYGCSFIILMVLSILFGVKMVELKHSCLSNHEYRPVLSNLFVDLKSLPKENDGFIPWQQEIDENLTIGKNSTIICIRRTGSYSISGYINFHNRGADTQSITIYIKTKEITKFFPENILPGSRRSIPFGADFDLVKGDTLSVKVDGLKWIYRSWKVHHFTIRHLG